jgi:transposase
MARSGGGWRMLPINFGPWQTVYWWFRRFVRRLLNRKHPPRTAVLTGADWREAQAA